MWGLTQTVAHPGFAEQGELNLAVWVEGLGACFPGNFWAKRGSIYYIMLHFEDTNSYTDQGYFNHKM